MPDTWAAQWAASWASGAQRYNMTHVPAGSAAGGQFGTSSGGASKGKTAPARGGHAARKAALLAQAKADRAKAHQLQQQLHILEKQAAAAHTAAQKSAASAAAAKKAGHPVHHHHHAAARKHHAAHHASLKTRIAGLQHQIATLLGQAKQLDAQAAKL